jgi:hypothetical protein
VKRYRAFIYLLVAISFFMPLHMAYLYQDYYSEMDLLPRKHVASGEDEPLLVFFQKNPRILDSPGPSIQPYVTSFLYEWFFLSDLFLPQDVTPSVLRC